MDFNEIMEEDLGDTFLNLDEFGKEIVIDSITIIGILDDGDTRANFTGTPSYGPDYGERIWEGKKTLYVRENDILPVPRSTQEIIVDGIQYQVSEVMKEDGLVILLLFAMGS